jgi:hypothetical protein
MIYFLPHRKHMMSPLQSPTGYCCLGKQSLFIVRTIRNTQIHSVDRLQSSLFVKQVVYVITTGFKWLHDCCVSTSDSASGNMMHGWKFGLPKMLKKWRILINCKSLHVEACACVYCAVPAFGTVFVLRAKSLAVWTAAVIMVAATV